MLTSPENYNLLPRVKFSDIGLYEAYFFTDFPAPTESGISETLSLGEKFLSLVKKSLSLAKNPIVLYMC